MAGGNFGGGTGTILNPFLVEDTADMNAIRSVSGAGKYFKLVNDIDLSLAALNAIGAGYSGAGWKPLLCVDGSPFGHYIDFNFKRITNLYINRPTEDNVGLIGKITGDITGKLNRVRIDGADITGNNGVGVMIGVSGWLNNGYAHIGDFSNISISGTKLVGNSDVGGVIGRLETTNNTINFKDIKVEILSIMGQNKIGGIIGNFNLPTAGSIGQFPNGYPVFNKVLTIIDELSGISYVGGLIGGLLTSVANTPAVKNYAYDCYCKINKYKRLYGTATSIGEMSGNMSSTFTRCYTLDTKQFLTP